MKPCNWIRFITLLPFGLLLSTLSSASDFAEVYKRVKPTVVTIKTNEYVERQTERGRTDREVAGIGSGILVKGGYVVTAAHVVHSADRLQVVTAKGDIFAARTISSISVADLAIIEIIDAPTNLPTAAIGDSDKVEVGEEVFVVGAPLGLSQTLTVGHLSGRRQQSNPGDPIDLEFLQTDASINQGNSGGPLFDSKGRVIGIVSHIKSTTGGSVGLGFAASINTAKKLFLNAPPIWTGMDLLPMSPTLLQALNAPYSSGLLVQKVAFGSLGAELGVKAGRVPATVGGQKVILGGDIIIGLGGQRLDFSTQGFERIWHYLNGLKKGSNIQVTVLRQGQEKNLSAAKP